MVQNILTVEDFNKILDEFAGQKIIRIPVTKTNSNITGQETLVEGEPEIIKAYFMRQGQSWDYAKQGFMEKGDAVALTKIADAVLMNEIILAEGVMIDISNVDGDATTITVDTSAAHGLNAGDPVIIAGTTNYNGEYEVASITDADTFTITDADHNLAAETSGTMDRSYKKFRVKERWDVPGVFDSTGNNGALVYTACNLFYAE